MSFKNRFNLLRARIASESDRSDSEKAVFALERMGRDVRLLSLHSIEPVPQVVEKLLDNLAQQGWTVRANGGETALAGALREALGDVLTASGTARLLAEMEDGAPGGKGYLRDNAVTLGAAVAQTHEELRPQLKKAEDTIRNQFWMSRPL